MNIVILHCHYQRGGVTQVVANHVRSLAGTANRILLVDGGRRDGLSKETLATAATESITGFDYDIDTAESGSTMDLVARLRATFDRHGFDPEDTVLHWHNHSLGKNTAAPAVIAELAKLGWRLLLQIHDFAEDNRPENYRRLIEACQATSKIDVDRYLYPLASQIHYATLTRADQSVLASIGIPEDQIHWLPNSVAAPDHDPPNHATALAKVRRAMNLPADARWMLYPVRGIRRKNVGEFLLLARWTDSETYSGITLRPQTPVEHESYDRWQQLAGDVAQRAVFDAAYHDELRLADNLAACDAVLSTSVAEGFGMTFLEPWLSDREVIARRLPTVTADFHDSGIEIKKMYDSIPIPGDPNWLAASYRDYELARNQAWAHIPPAFRPSAQGRNPSTDTIDFACLTPSRQMEVLRRLNDDQGFESETQQRSDELLRWLRSQADQDLIVRNRHIISDRYSITVGETGLMKVYQSLLNTATDPQMDSLGGLSSAIETVNRLRPFYPCRTEVSI